MINVLMQFALGLVIILGMTVAYRHFTKDDRPREVRAPVNVAELEHEVLSPEFMTWLFNIGELGHGRDCSVCCPPPRVAGSALRRPPTPHRGMSWGASQPKHYDHVGRVAFNIDTRSDEVWDDIDRMTGE